LINDNLGNLKAENGQKGIRLHPEKIIRRTSYPIWTVEGGEILDDLTNKI
jgi:hypothetical protein